MKPAQMQAPQNHNSFFLNAHEGYENAAMGAPQYGAGGPQTSSSQIPHGEDGGAYEARVENIQEEDEEDGKDIADVGVMPFVSEEFASF